MIGTIDTADESMAQVVVPSPHAYSNSIGNMAPAAPTIEMLPNPDFSFPRIDTSAAHTSHRRPKSMNMSAAPPRFAESSHRRGASALPSFSFNANDVSGLTGEEAADVEETAQISPSRGAHKRNTSELVGGLGMSGAISTSPTRSAALSIPPRQHRSRHSRSQLTLSSHDLSYVMNPEPQPRLSSSLPNTPLERPGQTSRVATDSQSEAECLLGPSLEEIPTRPPSRPRVEFSDNVEYIPRPLSTISSETEGSMSTVRGHSVNNSISSVLSLSTPSPPSARVRTTSLETTLEDEPRTARRSSLDVGRRIEKEGQWLKTGRLGADMDPPPSEPSSQSPKLTFAMTDDSAPKLRVHKKKQSLSHTLGIDRRKSEPAIGMHAGEPSRLSALSLQEQEMVAPYEFQIPPFETDQRSSSRKLKDWAVSKLSRKSKEWPRPSSSHLPIAYRIPAAHYPGRQPVVAETDLDAVFSLDSDDASSESVRAPLVVDATDPFFFNAPSSSGSNDHDDPGTMLDLDAALGPFQTPQLGSQKPRRELHSSRGTKDFVGPGGHYLPNLMHRRTESAPMLTPFDQSRTGTPPQAAMADVFEEDEEDVECESLQLTRPASTQSTQDDESGMGVEIVDSDSSSTPSVSVNEGLRIQHGDWESERPSTSYGNLTSRLSTPIMDRRASVIEETIMEEPSPVEPAIVESHEEPRAQSLTKSSDSSETPTILATPAEMLSLPENQSFLTTPESYQSSAFSSPDFPQRQNSFDTSRVGTSASSIADNRTISSCTTGEPPHDLRGLDDDVPSLTSSRSTMISTMHPNVSRRDVRTPSATSGTLNAAVASERRRKRASIQSLSQLVGGSFGPRLSGNDGGRPQTAKDPGIADQTPRREHRLKKLMFWKSKNRQASSSTIS